MKSSKKVLAFALAAAMVVTAVPATNAQAASTAKLSAKKATVYSEGYKTVTVKTPKSWKSVKVTATSNKKSVAKVKKTAAKKIKVTGVKPGTAKVTVKVTYKTSTKKNAKAKTKKLTYTMKVAKASVALSGDSAVAVGSTTKLTTTKKASSRAKITYTSSDETIATVSEDGTVKGVKAGKATITAKLTIGKDTATATQEVEVKNYVLSTVAQNKLTELTATVAGDTKNLKASDFTVKSEATKVVYPVSKVSVDSKDASKVTLTLFSELKDAATYDVTLDGITKTFVASDGKVASIALDKATIPYATETEIKLVSKDANGVIIKELKYGDTDNSYNFTIDTKGNGYTTGSKLYLNKIGDTAEATIEYKTGKYDQNGKAEGNIGPNKVTITAADQSAINDFKVRIDGANKKFDKAKDTNKIAAGETGKYAYFMIKDATGTEVSKYDYTVESSDKTVLMLASNTISSKRVGLTPVKQGTAYILFKDKDGKIVNSVAIDVTAGREAATLELDKYSVDASTSKTVAAKTVSVKVKDQYGDEVAASNYSNVHVSYLSGPVKNESAVAFDASKKAVVVTGSAFDASKTGAYVYKVAYTKDNKEIVAKTLTVNVQKPGSAVDSYRLDLDKSSVDVKVDNDNKDSKIITAQLMGRSNGVDLEAVKDVTYTVKKSDGTVVFGKDNGKVVTGAAFGVDANYGDNKTTGSNLNIKLVDVSKGVATKNLGAGTYTVTATCKDTKNNDVTITSSFTVTDTQTKASAEVKHNSVEPTEDTVEAALKAALVVAYGDDVYSNAKDAPESAKTLVISKVEGKLNDGTEFKTKDTKVKGHDFNISKLEVTVTVADGISMNVEVAVPGVITAK
jgi:hypothetical protein